MPVLEITEEQIISLLREMPAPERERVYGLASALPEAEPMRETEPLPQKSRPVFGSGKNDILYMADDFDAPLDDFKAF